MRLAVYCSAVAAMLILAASNALAADGEAVYGQHCAMCHASMSPKLGDKADWASVSKKGIDALVASTIKGKGAMPAQGGPGKLSDADVKAAVEYMASKSQ